jgi:hypothetical protein
LFEEKNKFFKNKFNIIKYNVILCVFSQKRVLIYHHHHHHNFLNTLKSTDLENWSLKIGRNKDLFIFFFFLVEFYETRQKSQAQQIFENSN